MDRSRLEHVLYRKLDRETLAMRANEQRLFNLFGYTERPKTG